MTRSLFDERTVRDVIGRLGRLTADRRPRWGRMSAGAMVCHLDDYFAVILGTRTARPAVSRWLQPFMRVALLHWPGRYPRNVRTLPELLITVPTDFTEDRQRLIDAIETFFSRRGETAWPLSPIAGRLTGKQWARLAHDHVAHHLHQFDL
jgi:hypothetical protein